MAHSREEPAGRDLGLMVDPLDIQTVYTEHGPVTVMTSLVTGARLRIPTDALPNLAAVVLTEWQDHEPDDDEEYP